MEAITLQKAQKVEDVAEEEDVAAIVTEGVSQTGTEMELPSLPKEGPQMLPETTPTIIIIPMSSPRIHKNLRNLGITIETLEEDGIRTEEVVEVAEVVEDEAEVEPPWKTELRPK